MNQPRLLKPPRLCSQLQPQEDADARPTQSNAGEQARTVAEEREEREGHAGVQHNLFPPTPEVRAAGLPEFPQPAVVAVISLRTNASRRENELTPARTSFDAI